MPRVDSVNFAAANAALSKNPRYTVEIDYGGGDKKYLTTHSDCEVPSGTSSSDIYYKTLKSFSSLSQKIDPLNARSSIGTIKINTIDVDSGLTTLFQTQRAAGKGERLKTVSVYVGYKGLVWADYSIVQTQVIENVIGGKGAYTINCADIQREARKKIFQVKTTNLTATLSATATTISVVSTTDFSTVYHGTSYSDAPSSTVGYVQIDEEIIRYTSKTSTTFTGCTRGVLNTKAVQHEVDGSASTDRQPEVTEYVYLELPAPKLAYALLTGTLYGDSATIPDHWHVGITSSLISTSQFTGIGVDLWDTTDDTKGLILRVSGKKDVTGKEFIEKDIYRLTGIYPRINVDGQLGVKRLNRILADAAYIEVLDKTNIADFGDLEHGKDVQNYYSIGWNYDSLKEKNTRINLLIDADSVTKYGETEAIDMDFGLMHGSKATLSTVKNTFNTLRDRYAAPPLRLSVTCLHRMNYLDVGDVVRCNLTDLLRDLADSTLAFDRSMEIERKVVDWSTGKVTFDLVGSAERAGVIVDSGTSTVLSASDYSTGHTELKAYLDSTYGTDVKATESGGILTISGDITLPGNASLAAGGNYYYLGDIVVNNGVTVTGSDNVGLWAQGFITWNGSFAGAGNGVAASASGTAGGVGTTKAHGGISISRYYPDAFGDPIFDLASQEEATVAATEPNIASHNITLDTANGLQGLPIDLRGSSGGTGGAITGDLTASAGVGGAGGAGLFIVCQGISAGVSSNIDLSGENGTAGNNVSDVGITFIAGTGGGGAGGALFILLDGSSSSITDVEDHFTCNNGASIIAGHRLASASTHSPGYTSVHSFYEGFEQADYSVTNYRVAYIHDLRDAEEDVAYETSVPSAITVQEGTGATTTVNKLPLEISVTPPSDGNYYGSRVFIAINGTDGWNDLGIVRSTDEVVFLADRNTTYEIRAYPISNAQYEENKHSNTYQSTTKVVGSAIETIFGTGNTLVSNTAPATNGGVIVDADGIAAFDSGGNQTHEVNAATGRSTTGDTASEQYVDFDPSTGIFEIGRDVQLRGVDAYNNNNIYFHEWFFSLDSWDITLGGSGTAILNSGFGVRLQNTGTASGTATIFRGFQHPLVVATWAKNRRFKIGVSFAGDHASATVYILVGISGGRAIGFKITNLAIEGYNHNGTSQTLTSLSTTLSSSTAYELEVIFISATSLEFFIDGVSKGTSTTNLPTGTTSADSFTIKHDKAASAGSETSQVLFGELKFLQEF